jgi:hypothetical protein
MASRLPLGPLRAPADGAERPVDVLVRGLLSGAVVGAVIAGSAIWERRQRRRKVGGVDDAATPTASMAAEPESRSG